MPPLIIVVELGIHRITTELDANHRPPHPGGQAHEALTFTPLYSKKEKVLKRSGA